MAEQGSWAYAANGGIWGFMSADDELGRVYLATETPSAQGGDFWGGKRPWAQYDRPSFDGPSHWNGAVASAVTSGSLLPLRLPRPM
jgi:hypothetical protein